MDLSSLIINYGMIGMVIAAMLSYSILPFPTEPVLVAALSYFTSWEVFIVVLFGATLGTIINYLIGLKGIRFMLSRKWKDRKAISLFEKWGGISIIMLSWFPLVGDALVVAAGAFRMRFWLMLLCATIGKAWYFALVVWVGAPFINLIF